MSQKQHLLVCIILLYILTLLMLVHYGEIINNAPLSQIVKLQKKAVRIIKWCSFNGINNSTLKFPDIVKLNTCMLFYDYFHHEKFPNIPVSLESELHNYNTCSASSNQVAIPSFRTNLRRFCPSVIGRFFWNSIPQLINHLKKCLGKHFYTGTLLNKNNETSSL